MEVNIPYDISIIYGLQFLQVNINGKERFTSLQEIKKRCVTVKWRWTWRLRHSKIYIFFFKHSPIYWRRSHAGPSHRQLDRSTVPSPVNGAPSISSKRRCSWTPLTRKALASSPFRLTTLWQGTSGSRFPWSAYPTTRDSLGLPSKNAICP